MKRNLIALSLAAAGLIASVPAFAASTTHTLNLSATINGNCRFNTAGPTAVTIGTPVAITTIDQSEQPAVASGAANVLYRCTTGTTAVTTAGNGGNFFGGARRVCVGATPCMPYSLGLVGGAQVGTGHGAGQDKILAVTATILAVDYQNAAAGAYTDAVILTISP